MSDHYFSTHPVNTTTVERSVVIRGIKHNVLTSTGVFSSSGLDKATSVFLDKVPENNNTNITNMLDVGCGWGPISLALADTYPQAQLWATDVNAQARALTKENLKRAGHSGNVCSPEEAFANIAPGTIDLIWSNPPIRIGKKALHQLLSDNLQLLSSHGNAYLVVGKNLGADSLTLWLQSQGYACQKIGSAKGFRILHLTH